MQLVHRMGLSQNALGVTIPLENQGSELGRLVLGPRRNGRPYNLHDRELLLQTANAVAEAIAFVGIKRNQP